MRNPQWGAGLKKHEIGEKISEMMYQEVLKLIRNKVAVYNSRPDLDKRGIAHFTLDDVPEAFGTDFRQMRSRFPHMPTSRVNKDRLTLNEFFLRPHKYILLMYNSCAFIWNIKDVEAYNWQEIDKFFNVVNSNLF